MTVLSTDDYNELQEFIGVVLRRLESGELNHLQAVEEIMHPLTAWSDGRGDSAEFVPYMKTVVDYSKRHSS